MSLVKTCEATVGCSRQTATPSASLCARHLDAYAAGVKSLDEWERQQAGNGRRRSSFKVGT